MYTYIQYQMIMATLAITLSTSLKNFTNFRGLQWFWGGDSDIHLVFSHGDHSSYTQFFCSTFKRALVSEVDTER